MMLKQKLKNTRIWTTLLFFAVLGGILFGVAMENYRLERERCFQQLNSYVSHAGRTVARNVEWERAYLESVARALSRQDLTDFDATAKMLSDMGDTGLISRLELLLPGNLLLEDDDRLSDATGQLCFLEDARRDGQIFWRKGEREGTIILRQYVPVERDGKAVALLCGVLDLRRITRYLSSDEYGSEMRMFIFERGSGQFLMDTWSEELSTRNGQGNWECAEGYSQEKFKKDIAVGRPSTIVSRSTITGENFYTRAAPVAVEDWTVMVTVPDSAAFAFANRILRLLCTMMLLILLAILVYWVWTFRDIRRERLERERKLKNIEYILDVEEDLFHAQTDRDQFHNALRKAAEFLPAERTFFWSADSLAFQQLRWWSDGGEECLKGVPCFQDQFPGLLDRGAVVCRKDGLSGAEPWVQALCQELQTDSLMLVPVKDRNGTLSGVLGATGLKQKREDTEPLEQVAVIFSATRERYDVYRRLDRLGHIDAMTGLRNRNGYEEDLASIRPDRCQSMACVYADANGLHEINNRLGHAAGDEMLIQIAEALTAHFPGDLVYRIGGDEFVVLCRDQESGEVHSRVEEAKRQIQGRGYEASIGVAYREGRFDLMELVESAEAEMRASKERYYNSPERDRQLRLLDERATQLFSRQRDMESFLTALAPQFKGVYFVDLNRDSIRGLFIPSYFEKFLVEEDGKFSKGLLLYAERLVEPAYREAFEALCDFDALSQRLDRGDAPTLLYRKNDGSWVQLRVTRTTGDQTRETLWTFEDQLLPSQET